MATKVTRNKHKRKIQKLYNQLIRDNWGNLIKCEINELAIEEIEKSKKYL